MSMGTGQGYKKCSRIKSLIYLIYLMNTIYLFPVVLIKGVDYPKMN